MKIRNGERGITRKISVRQIIRQPDASATAARLRRILSRSGGPTGGLCRTTAKLLETSAEYLVTGVKQEDLNNTERKLITAYRKLSQSDRENVILAINAWAGKNRR